MVVLHDGAPVQAAQRGAGLGERVAVAAVVHVVRDAGHQQGQELDGEGGGGERKGRWCRMDEGIKDICTVVGVG